jgi:hypothetical protein
MEAAMKKQHMRALAQANEARLDGSEIKREIAEGRVTLAEALDDYRARSVELLDLFKAPHRMGRARAQRVIRMAQLHENGVPLLIPENKQVKHLTESQKGRLRAALPDGM